MGIKGAREIRRNHMAYIRSPAIPEEAVKYLLDKSERIFKLHLKSTDILYNCTTGNGSCCFRAFCQAAKRAVFAIYLRDNTPVVDVNYNNKPERNDQLL